jgi:hypothetical protein
VTLREDAAARALAVAFAVALTAALATIGADARWLVELGGAIVREGDVPRGVPYASAPSADWHNVPVLAELLFHAAWWALRERGLLLLQLAAVAAAFWLLGADARRSGAGGTRIAAALAITAVGAVGTLAVVRVQLFSLALFPALLLLLRTESRRPSPKRIWLLVPLIALWSNLHGAVLLGLAVALAYLALERGRRRPLESAFVALAAAVALAATPAGLDTFAYYRGVAGSEAARRKVGLWEPLSFRSPLDIVLVLAALTLVAVIVRSRRRPPAWELAAAAALAVATARTGRTGVFLLFFLAAPAALALTRPRGLAAGRSAAVAVALVVVTAAALVRGPILVAAHAATVRAAIARAEGSPILAEDALAEQVALAGGRIWVGNPLDAYAIRDQRTYLDWLEGRPAGDAALRHAPRAVLVHADSRADRRLRHDTAFEEVARDRLAALYARRR